MYGQNHHYLLHFAVHLHASDCTSVVVKQSTLKFSIRPPSSMMQAQYENPTGHSHTATLKPKSFTIAIVGGGIGGLSLAIGLLRHNIPVQIYEAAPCFAEVGAGLTLGPNVQRAVSLLSPALGAATEKISTPTGREEKRRNWITLRLGMDVKVEPENGVKDLKMPQKAGEILVDCKTKEVGWGKSQCTVHRAKYLDEMVKMLPEGITTFNKKLVNFKDGQDGNGIILEFSDGSTAAATALIGCDGIKSRTRELILGEQTQAPQFAGIYAYRALIPMEKAIKAMGEGEAPQTILNIGYDGFVLTYPTDNFSVVNTVAGRFKKDGQWEHENWIRSSSRETLFHDWKGWGDHVIKILECVDKPDQWALHELPAIETYCRGKICLLGDSAHASTPMQGSGGGMALEDSYILSNLIGDVESEEDLERVFRIYDKVRRPRTQKQIATSRDLGDIYMLRGVEIGDDMTKVIKSVVDRHDWI